MSNVLIGGLVGAVGASFIVKRVKEVKMYYTNSGEHDALIAVCVSDSCLVDHKDIDGEVQRDVNLSSNDLVIGGKVTVKSGRMFVMAAEKMGVI